MLLLASGSGRAEQPMKKLLNASSDTRKPGTYLISTLGGINLRIVVSRDLEVRDTLELLTDEDGVKVTARRVVPLLRWSLAKNRMGNISIHSEARQQASENYSGVRIGTPPIFSISFTPAKRR